VNWMRSPNKYDDYVDENCQAERDAKEAAEWCLGQLADRNWPTPEDLQDAVGEVVAIHSYKDDVSEMLLLEAIEDHPTYQGWIKGM
jgi:membrane peptidoglycan carboxypeptidase